MQTDTNTFQAVLATDGTRSYAIYTYECGKLNWVHYFAAIGFSASPDFLMSILSLATQVLMILLASTKIPFHPVTGAMYFMKSATLVSVN